jgi:bifunctional ADP-heptose synthase (sugar kinase/adenylyltransferase)
MGRKLLKRLSCKALVITQGEKGMTIFERHQKPYRVPTVAKEVYDVTGAGDTVIGTMALALGTGPSVTYKDAAQNPLSPEDSIIIEFIGKKFSNASRGKNARRLKDFIRSIRIRCRGNP